MTHSLCAPNPARLRRASVALLLALAACGDQGPSDAPEMYVAGEAYLGTSGYVEYLAGNLPVIVSAPHGGSLLPEEIPDRTAARCGGEATTARDTNTEELARQIRGAFHAATGRYPHIVINRLHRRKLDANRALTEAACAAAAAETAYREFHGYVESARSRILADFGRGWYTDLHGHGHAIARLELGYLLSAATLRSTDAALNASTAFEDGSSVRTFSRESPLSFAELIRGPTSLGSLFQAEGYRAVPGGGDPAPLVGEDFFSGGYNTATWGCASGGNLCGVQIEAQFAGVRDTEASRDAFAAALVRVYSDFLSRNFGLVLGQGEALTPLPR